MVSLQHAPIWYPAEAIQILDPFKHLSIFQNYDIILVEKREKGFHRQSYFFLPFSKKECDFVTGNKRISELITDKDAIKAGRINIIDADVSAGKTFFALNVLPEWAGSASKILYLIDTTNGEMRIQKNIRTVGRQTYSFYSYGQKSTWGERSEAAENNMPVMTYAGFGAEVRKKDSAFPWHDFEYIVCDEMQNLVN